MSDKLKKIILIITAFTVIFLLYFYNSNKIFLNQKTESVISFVKESIIPQDADQKKIKLVFVGDIMLSRQIGKISAEKGDWTYMFHNVADEIRDADIAFANLENPVSIRGIKVGSIYSFRADPKSIEGLVYAGFDIVSIANNHIWDYGEEAFEDTLSLLKVNNIRYLGGGLSYMEAHNPVIFNIKNMRIAYFAYTDLLPKFLGEKDSKWSVAFPDIEQIKTDIENVRDSVDIIVVSFHFGEEYQTVHNDFQENLAHIAIDAGANLIIGHHPHVMQDIETYKEGIIVYSFGNFVFDQNFSEDTRVGGVFSVTISDGEIFDVDYKFVKFNQSFQPYFAETADL